MSSLRTSWGGFRAYFIASFRQTLTYKSSFWTLTVGIFVLIALQTVLWRAIGEQPSARLDAAEITRIVAYVSLSRMVAFLLPNAATMTFISTRVTSGSIAVDLLRPIGLMWAAFANELAKGVARVLFQITPALIAALVLLNLDLPTGNAMRTTLALVSFLLAYLISFLLSYLIGISALWLGTHMGVAAFRDALNVFLGGSLVPITLFPGWLKSIAYYLPFQATYYVPIAVFTGLPVDKGALVLQVVWLVALAILSHFATGFAIRKAVLHGG